MVMIYYFNIFSNCSNSSDLGFCTFIVSLPMVNNCERAAAGTAHSGLRIDPCSKHGKSRFCRRRMVIYWEITWDFTIFMGCVGMNQNDIYIYVYYIYIILYIYYTYIYIIHIYIYII